MKLVDLGFRKFRSIGSETRTPRAGNFDFTAPEVLYSSEYTNKSDMWSLGVICFYLLSGGQMPFDGTGGDDAQMRQIRQGRYVMNSKGWSKVCSMTKDFIRSLLEVEAQKRLSARRALRHKWILKHSITHIPEQLHQAVKDSLCTWKAAPKFQRSMMSVMAASLSREQHAQVRDYFLAMDRDRNGILTIGELSADFQGSEEDEAETASVASSTIFGLDFVSVRGDSIENTQDLSYTDFLAAMMASYIPITDGLLRACFKKFDPTDSGYIVAEDMREVLGDTFEDENVEDLLGEVGVDYEEFVQKLCPNHSVVALSKNGTMTSSVLAEVDEHRKNKPCCELM